MAVGINEDNINALKVYLLDCQENINALSNRLSNCRDTINSGLDGDGKASILKKLNASISQLSRVRTNISNYIVALDGVVKSYKNQDDELASKVIGDIDKIGN